jgi:hypothetical protein
MVSNQQLLANFGFTVIPALEMISAPSLRAETEPGVYCGVPYATLEESYLVLAPGNLLFLPPVNTPSAGGSD